MRSIWTNSLARGPLVDKTRRFDILMSVHVKIPDLNLPFIVLMSTWTERRQRENGLLPVDSENERVYKSSIAAFCLD